MRLRTKLPLMVAAIAVTMGALFATWVHVSTRDAIREEARTAALRDLDVESRTYLASGISTLTAVLDDPDAPAEVLRRGWDGELVTYLDETTGLAWAGVPVEGARVLVTQTSWTSGLDVLRRVDRNLVLGVLALTLASALAAFLATRTVSGRLRRAERTAQAISDGDLGARVSSSVGGRDEVTRLAHTIDDLAARMQQRLAAEKRVTADIAHDLRTPLTGLLAAASVLPDGRPTELVRSQVERLRRLVEDLLEVARLDESDQRLDADEVATRALAARALSAAEVPDVDFVILGDATVETDPRRVERVLVNLLANAVAHGAPPLRVEVDGRAISVMDSGAGYPEDLMTDGPQRFRTGAAERGHGHGLGLTIAAGQARALGATLTFSNEPGGGARATLELPLSGPRPQS
ncbi:MAG TPA: HAMP domain-containing sensor histidine kinase [Phycicoccus sp.]|nr:HAMP domain-containing sensor histidine kinase [Phycicoccus sp.]